MGNPVRDFGGYEARFGIGSALDKAEWDQYMATHRQLVDSLFQEIQGLGQRLAPPPEFGDVSAGASSLATPLTVGQQPRQQGMDELLGQAQYWGVQNPQAMTPDQLYQEIQSRRQGVERPAEPSTFSQAAGGVGILTGASESLAHVVRSVLGLVDEIPLAGPTLARVAHTEDAKNWLSRTAQGLESWTEWARAVQPQSDRTATDIAIATGKVAGYALPAWLAWEGMGAAGASARLAPWSARVTSPFLRSAIQGAATGTVLEAGSDDPRDQKILNIGLGAVLGFSTAIPRIGSSLAYGGLGAGVGGQVGATPEERSRNAAIFGVAGALLPLAPMFLRAGIKVRTDFQSAHDAAVNTAIAEQPMGYQGPRRPVQAQGRVVGQQALQAGPDYEVMPAGELPSTPADMQRLLVRSEPQTPEDVISLGQPPQPAVQGTPDLLRLMSPERAETTEQLREFEALGPGDEYIPELRNQLYGLPPQRIVSAVNMALEGTKVVDANGAPLTVYHGTGVDFESFDLSKGDPGALYGPGFYHTESPEIAAGYAQSEQVLGQEELAQLGGNIRPARLNIQNPFDVDRVYPVSEANSLIDRIEQTAPQFDWNAVRRDIVLPPSQIPYSEGVTPPLTGDDLYTILSDAKLTVPRQAQQTADIALTGQWLDLYQGPNRLTKVGLNNVLREVGYDGITYIGGRITGSPPHRVWIAFDPGQVQSPWDVPALDHDAALSTAQAMTKQATIMESPNLAEDVGKAQLTDQDVVDAAEAVNPAGVSIVRGIDPVKWGEGTLREFLGKAAGRNITFVAQPGNKLDALVGQVSPVHVEQYRKFGIFQGQRVVTTTGLEGTILNPSTAKGKVVVSRDAGPPMVFNRDKILPSRFSAPQVAVPDLWNSFKADILGYLNGEAGKAGMPAIESIFDPRASGLLHDRMYDFFDRMGVNEPAMRQALDENFTRQYAREAKDLDPEMRDLQATLVDQAIQAHNAVEESTRPIPVSLEEAAQSKGFVWVSRPGDGGAFHDTLNPGTPAIPVETDQAAQSFLANVDRGLPDVTPSSDAPLEVADLLSPHPQIRPRLTAEDEEDSLQETVSALAADNARDAAQLPPGGTGGGALPPGGNPPPPLGLGPGFYGMGPVPPPPPTLGGQFATLRGFDPVKYHSLQNEFSNSVMMRLHYTRSGMLHLENRLTEEGLTLGRAWDMWRVLADAKDQAHREGFPWMQEIRDIVRLYPRRVVRDGTAARIHEIEDPNARYAAIYRLAETHGYDQRKISRVLKADQMVTDFFDRIGATLSEDPSIGLSHDRLIFRYLPQVRARQAQEVPDPYQVEHLPRDLQFFGEHIREGEVQTRIMDIGRLMTMYVNGAYSKKYMAEPWANLVQTWDDPRIPTDIKSYVLDAARLIRYGYDARGELLVRGMKGMMQKFGIPVSTSEAQRLLSIPQGALYMPLMAGKAANFFRDGIQPLMTLQKVPLRVLQGVYGDFLRGGAETRAAMFDQGLRGGWVQQENPNVENVGLFEATPQTAYDLGPLTPQQAALRENVSRVGDLLHELPDVIARPWQSKFNTLLWYAKLGKTNRLISGEAGRRWAAENIDAFRRSTIEAAITGDASKVMSYDQLADKTNVTAFDPPIQQKFRELVSAGDDEGAAALYAKELANETQQRYGRAEMPPALRGTVGRAAFTLGNFSGQYAETIASLSRNGSPRQKIRAWMVHGGIAAALLALQAETGWKFSNWVWGQSLSFTGSPLLEAGIRGAAAYMGAVGTVAGDRPVPAYQQEAMRDVGNTTAGDILGEYSPFRGYARSIEEYYRASQGANPVEQMLRFTITGDRGSAIDIRRMLERRGIEQGGLSPNGGQMPGSAREGFPPGGFPPAAFPPKPTPGGGFQQ